MKSRLNYENWTLFCYSVSYYGICIMFSQSVKKQKELEQCGVLVKGQVIMDNLLQQLEDLSPTQPTISS